MAKPSVKTKTYSAKVLTAKDSKAVLPKEKYETVARTLPSEVTIQGIVYEKLDFFPSKPIELDLEEDLLLSIDAAAKRNGHLSRAGFIRQALGEMVLKLQQEEASEKKSETV